MTRTAKRNLSDEAAATLARKIAETPRNLFTGKLMFDGSTSGLKLTRADVSAVMGFMASR